ncbi:hypothetical protein RBA41_31255 [Massilia sp. CCM 9210]|uniref:hypothetical protein n=1 Tax=Massilia scottii TaxID=3057166 RepID=UPI0027963EE4|nr:hypothetical protein [Massilia sp. CCM 9210]MDQ1817788.1 hypothetical protein [Massilia sp. CCM 9210]
MNVNEAKKKFGEPLSAIEDRREAEHAHYLRVEEAVGHSSLAEIQAYYASLHGMLVEDVVLDQRFPWNANYQYGDAANCCASCKELEMAITCNIVSKDSPMAQWFPQLAFALPNDPATNRT